MIPKKDDVATPTFNAARNRRRYPRVRAPVYFRPAKLRITLVPVADIGFGGVRVYSDEVSSIGEVLDIELFLSNQSSVMCTAEVAWVSRLPEGGPAKYDVGLRFVHLPAGFLHRVRLWTRAEEPRVRVIIVNEGDHKATVDTLRVLFSAVSDSEKVQVVIVNDGAEDDSTEQLSAAVSDNGWSDTVVVMSAGPGRGYAAKVNAALRFDPTGEGTADYVYLLSPLASPEPSAVRALTDILIGLSEVGIAGSRARRPDGETLATVSRFPGFVGEIAAAFFAAGYGCSPSWRSSRKARAIKTGHVDWVTRTSMMIRREVLDTIGLFDETLSHEFVEIDFCRRARRAGWSIFFVCEIGVTHPGPIVTKLDRLPPRDRNTWLASRQEYFRKTHGPVLLFCANIAFGLALALRALLHRDTDAAFSSAFFRFCFRRGPSSHRPVRMIDAKSVDSHETSAAIHDRDV